MSFAVKFAVVLICAATCALGLLPRAQTRKAQPPRSSVTPAQLHGAEPARWLLV